MTTFNTQNSVSFALRHKYFQSSLQQVLRNALVSRAVFAFDESNLKTIENPYISTSGTATIQAVAGTYAVTAMATTEDSLTIADEVLVPTHIFDFEKKTANFNLFADFLDDMAYQVALKVDQFAINKITDVGSGTYTTPAGGFTTAANIPVICANLLSKVAGYAGGVANTPFLVIESTDVVGFAQAQVASGFSYADLALKNGFMTNYMGIEIYVVRSGTFTNTDLGTFTTDNAGHRLFGIKGLAPVGTAGGFGYDEKMVTGKTGREVVAYGYVGATVWANHRTLFVDITLA